jgi:hypothetical protein
VYAPIHDRVSHDAESHKKVQAKIEEVVVEINAKRPTGASMSPQVATNLSRRWNSGLFLKGGAV